MIRGCGGTLSLVVHAFGPSFRTIPPRASHYSTRETLSFGLPIEPFQSRSLSSSIQIVLECLLTDDVSRDVDQRARALKQPNDRSSSRIAIPYRFTFTFNLTVRKSSCCILAITPHPCSFFHLRGSIEIRTISLVAEQRSTIKLCSGSSWSNTGSQWSSYRKILFRRFYETLRGTIFSNDDG